MAGLTHVDHQDPGYQELLGLIARRRGQEAGPTPAFSPPAATPERSSFLDELDRRLAADGLAVDHDEPYAFLDQGSRWQRVPTAQLASLTPTPTFSIPPTAPATHATHAPLRPRQLDSRSLGPDLPGSWGHPPDRSAALAAPSPFAAGAPERRRRRPASRLAAPALAHVVSAPSDDPFEIDLDY